MLHTGISFKTVLAESYTFAEHEQRVGKLAEDMGFTHVSLSSEVMSMVKAVPRGFTTAADAYLTPVIARYVKSFRSGFDQVRYGTVRYGTKRTAACAPRGRTLLRMLLVVGPSRHYIVGRTLNADAKTRV